MTDTACGPQISVSSSSPSSSDYRPSISIMDHQRSEMAKKINRGEYKIAIYGLGHVGSAMASVWLRKGAHVIGVDKSHKVLENARKGKTHIPEPGVNEAYRAGIQSKRFELYDNLDNASHDSYFKMVCVPVTLSKDRSADMTALKEVASAIGRGLKKGDVVAINPSVPPGTTEDIIAKIVEQESGGLKAEADYFLLYNPERIYEGRAIEDIEIRYPAIISGAGPMSTQVGEEIYSLIFKKGVIIMSSIRAAETEKLFEGVYRDVNIALSNELAKFCEKVGVDFWDIRNAANSQPFCNIHRPGVGVGGACIPVYPQFIVDTAQRVNANSKLIELGREINSSMPFHCVQQAVNLLNEKRQKQVRESTITLLGLAFRGGVSDTRLSPTYDVVEEFKKLGVREIRIHDPLVFEDSKLSKEGNNISLTSNINEAVHNTDLVFIVTDHPEYSSLTSDSFGDVPIYDGRGILDRSKFDSSTIFAIGIGLNHKG
ncbi:MAG TPA: nucleotide sugar dehydrogenase [Nitrososphaeraceae archaeon]